MGDIVFFLDEAGSGLLVFIGTTGGTLFAGWLGTGCALTISGSSAAFCAWIISCSVGSCTGS